MRRSLPNIPPEIAIAGAMMAVMFSFSAAYSLPIVVPTGEQAEFVGVHYIYPLIGVGMLGMMTFLLGKREVAMSFLVALPCYCAILFAHFNIKLWIPHINPLNYDNFYRKTDEMVRPIVDICMYIRENILFFIPYSANFYMIGFITLFYTSFMYHAMKTPEHFRTLVISVLLLQALGALAYLVAPAVGPFIYEKGMNPTVTAGQLYMLDFYQNSLAHGPEWIAGQGSAHFTIGLAAMPSLHAAGAFLFFIFAWKHGRALVPIYAFILIFILVTSVATRWHYVIDVPAGLALAWACVSIAERIHRRIAVNAASDLDALVPVAA